MTPLRTSWLAYEYAKSLTVQERAEGGQPGMSDGKARPERESKGEVRTV
jgi:hypothetical protein